ncbi:MAG TPA: hypothetical protein PK507_00890 [bacterium]|nr:hypothetical protein [bacterium]HRS70177.1 hypothetical protein [Bacteroidales bacterium]
MLKKIDQLLIIISAIAVIFLVFCLNWPENRILEIITGFVIFLDFVAFIIYIVNQAK